MDRDKIEEKIAFLLLEKNISVGVAESCSGGLLAHRLTNISGSSGYFSGGVVAYANEVKTKLLKVPEALIQKQGAVCEEVAIFMARGIRLLVGSDLGVGITGIAGPTGETKEKPVGLVYIAVVSNNFQFCKKNIFSGNREEVKYQTSETALQLILEMVTKDK